MSVCFVQTYNFSRSSEFSSLSVITEVICTDWLKVRTCMTDLFVWDSISDLSSYIILKINLLFWVFIYMSCFWWDRVSAHTLLFSVIYLIVKLYFERINDHFICYSVSFYMFIKYFRFLWFIHIENFDTLWSFTSQAFK